MNTKQFKDFLDKSVGAKFIITGLIDLIEKDGMTTHEALEFLEDIKRNTFHALKDIEMRRG